MGVYLSEPNKTKVSETGSSNFVRYAASSMQGTFFFLFIPILPKTSGWRTNMEDAHIANVNLDDDCCIFGVFDGHGGELLF